MLDAYADRWALITGASSGIGAEFARKLAARGMHLVLAARRQELMQELAEELHTRHGTKSEIIPIDLSLPHSGRELYEKVVEKGISVELLINNAGFGIVGEVDEADIDSMLQMVQLNIGTLTELTYLFLPEMLKRQHGAIINLSSLSAFQPVAYMGAYAATKTYALHFSEALWAEVRDRGVTVMALCPGVTETSFFDVAGVPGWLKKQRSQTPQQVVKRGLKALEKRRQYVVTGWANYLMTLVVRLFTRRTVVNESKKYFRPRRKKTSQKQTS